MTKTDIAERIHLKSGLKKNESNMLLESVLSIMKDALESGEDIKIAGFGKFAVKKKKDRKGRNPQTGEPLTIEARQVLTFKPSALLKEKINGR